VPQQPKRLPGEGNPTRDADAPIRPLSEADWLGRESLAGGAGLVGGIFGPGDGGFIRRILELRARRRSDETTKRTR
jgi:hypothetical protein